ncbi:MAG: hypothetical protein IKS45_05070 [Thermoguttaceae bacterium]|nr:hypothetical protein [Thermoguttaceae bacterium]
MKPTEQRTRKKEYRQITFSFCPPARRAGGKGTETITNASQRAYQNDEAENLPLDGACLGRQLDGFAVKEKAEASKNLLTWKARLNNRFAGVSPAEAFLSR